METVAQLVLLLLGAALVISTVQHGSPAPWLRAKFLGKTA